MPHFLRVAVILASLALSAQANAADIAIDQAVLASGGKAKITFKNIILKDCNLSQEEANSLFTGALSREDAGALLERMTASEVTIPEAQIETEHGRFTLRNIVGEGLDHGAARTLGVAGLDGVLPDDSGDATLHLGAVRAERVSIPGLAAALRTGDPIAADYRFSHLSWEGGEFSMVDKQTPAGAPGGNRIQLRAGPAKVDQNFNADGLPLDNSASFTGFLLKLPPQSKAGAAMASFGYRELAGDIEVAAAYDPAAKTSLLKNYSIDIKNVGRIALSGQISGLANGVFVGDRAAREKAALEGLLDWMQIDVTNSGLFDKMVGYFALGQGKTPGAVKSDWRAIISQAPLLFQGAPAIAVMAQALDRFIADPKTLTLKVKTKDALKLGDLAHIDDPAALLNRLEVTSPTAPAEPPKPASGTRL